MGEEFSAGGGSRTLTELPRLVFETSAYANSATGAVHLRIPFVLSKYVRCLLYTESVSTTIQFCNSNAMICSFLHTHTKYPGD